MSAVADRGPKAPPDAIGLRGGPNRRFRGSGVGQAKRQQFAGRKGTRYEVALCEIASDFAQKVETLYSLDSFCDDLQAKRMGEVHRRADQKRITAVFMCILDEASIDFQFAERQGLEIGQRRLPGAVVV